MDWDIAATWCSSWGEVLQGMEWDIAATWCSSWGEVLRDICLAERIFFLLATLANAGTMLFSPNGACT